MAEDPLLFLHPVFPVLVPYLDSNKLADASSKELVSLVETIHSALVSFIVFAFFSRSCFSLTIYVPFRIVALSPIPNILFRSASVTPFLS